MRELPIMGPKTETLTHSLTRNHVHRLLCTRKARETVPIGVPDGRLEAEPWVCGEPEAGLPSKRFSSQSFSARAELPRHAAARRPARQSKSHRKQPHRRGGGARARYKRSPRWNSPPPERVRPRRSAGSLVAVLQLHACGKPEGCWEAQEVQDLLVISILDQRTIKDNLNDIYGIYNII